jgi:ATP-binding cassette, subfamily B, bacterial
MDKPERLPWLKPRRSTILGLQLIWGAGPAMATWLVALSVLEGLLPAAFAIASGLVVGAAREGAEPGDLARALTVMGLVLVASEAIPGARYAFVEGFQHRVNAFRRERIIRAAQSVPGLAHLEDPQVLDSLRPAARTDWPDTGAFAASVFGYTSTRVMGLASAALIWSFRWWLATALVVMWWWSGHIMRQTQADSWGDTFGRMRRPEYLRHLVFEAKAAKEVRIFGFGPWLIDSFSRGWTEVMTDVWRRRRAGRYRQIGVLIAVLTAHIWVFDLIATAARGGELQAAQLVVIAPAVLAVARLGIPDHFTLGLASGAAVLPHIEQTEQLVSEERFHTGGVAPAEELPKVAVRFENVAFNYASRPDSRLYQGLDLEIPAGKSLAIVGANGAGKTTLVKLLARLYEPTEGRITVDGTPLSEIDPVGWQRRVAAIFQDFTRYFLNAGDNVGYGAVEHLGDRARLQAAATKAGADNLVDGLPSGWDTILTRQYEGGTDLSGGEWQRIALARALFAVEGGAGILVLDEPTANLDVRAEVDLFDRFLEVTKGTTTVLISHRFSTVRRADRIVVLEGGQVTEQGTHDELIALDGAYARAFRLQANRYTDSETAA